MSSQSKKSTSWFVRLGSALRRKRPSAALGQNLRELRFESLESRSLLSATVLPSISGIVYQEAGSETPLPNITVNLWSNGGGSSVFQGNSSGSSDTLIATTTSGANGAYQFNNLAAGTYFVQQDPVPGLTIPSSQSVQTVVITPSELQGTTGTTIDSFATTAQYVSGSLHGGKTGTSSQSTTDAIGGHRNLYVQLSTAGGAVDLGADSDWPGLLDFGADAASNGIFWVNWDGNNSNAAVLNPTGLGGLNVTSHGASTGIELNAAADHDNGFLMLKVFTDANDWSWATVPVTNTGDGSLNSGDSQFVAFSSFTVGGGAGANFSKVGAIQLAINGVNAIDGQVGPIEAVGPTVVTANFVNSAQADLAVVKTGAPNPIVAGNQLTYTFTTTNNGPSNDTNVTLADTLPAGETYVSSGGQGTVTNNNGAISVQLGSLAAGAADTTSIVVAIGAGVTGSLTNTVTVTGDLPDPVSSNNSSTVTTQVGQSADLAVVKTATPSPVKPGGQLTYTFTTTDNGPSAATGVTLADTLPAGETYVSSNGQGTVTNNSGAISVQLGNLAVGAVDTTNIVVAVSPSATGSLTNTVTVSGNQPDPVSSNNSSTVTTQIDVPVVPQSTNGLTLVKKASPSPAIRGYFLTYTLVVDNTSLTTATDVTIVDPLPTGFSYYYASGDNSTTISGNTLTLNLGSMASQASETVTIVGEVTAAAANTIINTATVKDDQGDLASASVSTPVVDQAQGSKYYLLGQ